MKTSSPGGEGMAHELMITGKKMAGVLPVVFAPDAKTAERVVEFFTAQGRKAGKLFHQWSLRNLTTNLEHFSKLQFQILGLDLLGPQESSPKFLIITVLCVIFLTDQETRFI